MNNGNPIRNILFYDCIHFMGFTVNTDRKKCEAQFLPFRYFYVTLGRKIVRHIFPWGLTNCNKKNALSHLDTICLSLRY